MKKWSVRPMILPCISPNGAGIVGTPPRDPGPRILVRGLDRSTYNGISLWRSSRAGVQGLMSRAQVGYKLLALDPTQVWAIRIVPGIY